MCLYSNNLATTDIETSGCQYIAATIPELFWTALYRLPRMVTQQSCLRGLNSGYLDISSILPIDYLEFVTSPLNHTIMAAPKITLYFDVVSPFAYIAFHALRVSVYHNNI